MRSVNVTKIILYIDVFIFLVCASGIYQISEKSAIGIIFRQQNGKVIIDNVPSSLGKTGLNREDVILSIAGYPVSLIEDIEFICDGLEIGQTVIIQAERHGRIISESVKLTDFYSLPYLVICAFLGSFFFLTGVFVLIKKPDELVAQVCHWAFVGAANVAMTTWGRFTIEPAGLGHLIRLVFSAAYAFTPILYLHMSFIFPRIKWPIYRRLMVTLYIWAFLLSLGMSISHLRAVQPIEMEWFRLYFFFFSIARWTFVLCIFIGLLNFFHSYFAAQEEAERKQLLWILYGVIIGPLCFALLWQIPQAFTGHTIISEELLLILTLATPITFAIALVRHHIFDIDLIVNRSTVYVIVLTIALLIYTAIVGGAAFIVGSLSVETSIFASTIAAVLIGLLFDPARHQVQIFIDKIFFRMHYNYRIAQREFSVKINDCYDLKTLADFSVEQIDRLLQPQRVGFILNLSAEQYWQMLSHKNWEIFSVGAAQQLIASVEDSHKLIISLPANVETGAEINLLRPEAVDPRGLALAVIIQSQDTKINGFFILGAKKSAARFNLKDIDLLKSFATQVGLAIDRIILQQELIIRSAEARRLEELNQLKSYLVSSVSHELQTPLTSIKMFAELLKSKTKIAKAQQQEYLDIIEGESERLSRLIKNLLDFAKIEHGVQRYHFSTVNLKELIENALRIMNYQLNRNGFTVHKKIPKKKILLNLDFDAMTEALTNLISNAIKFSLNEKRLEITAGLHDEYAIIAVKDKGIGMKAEEQDHIFEAFFRSQEKQVQALGGSGLGLTLVQQIVLAHKGRIEVQSAPNEGSTFRIYLPLETGHEQNINH